MRGGMKSHFKRKLNLIIAFYHTAQNPFPSILLAKHLAFCMGAKIVCHIKKQHAEGN
jgi:hypothetical protein